MKCVFIDIDGTLYNSKKNEVLDSSLLAIKKLRENGNKVFICTGRSLSESIKYINIPVDGFVFCAGSVIYVEGKLMYKKSFEIDEIKKISSRLEELDFGYCLDGDAGAYNNEKGLEHVRNYFKGSELDKEKIEKEIKDNCFFSIDYWDERDSICKICIFGKGKYDFNLLNDLLSSYTQTLVSEDNKEDYCIEITHKNHNKATAAKFILDYYGLDFDDAVAIGDSDNDYEIVQNCGIGIAMGNGNMKLKEIADVVTDNIDDDGLYNAFVKIGMIK